MVRSKITLESNSIKNILTLRYDTTKKSQIRPRNWRDFVERSTENASGSVESMITSNIKKSVKNSTKMKITVALSSGVDSTLVLSLLRKNHIYTLHECCLVQSLLDNTF